MRKPSLVAVFALASIACGPPRVSTESDANSGGTTSGAAESTTSVAPASSGESSGPSVDVSSSGTVPTPSTTSSDSGSSSTGEECGCIDDANIALDEPREGLTFADRLAMFPTEFTLTWVAVEGTPQTTVSLDISASNDLGRYDAGGDQCPLNRETCLDGVSLSIEMTLQSADGFLVAELGGPLRHHRPFETQPLTVNTQFPPTEPLFEQTYLDPEGVPFVPEYLEVYITLDPVTQQLETFDLSAQRVVLAELSEL